MEELARQIQSYVDANSDPDNVSWADSRFYTGSRRAGDALVPSLRRHVARQIKDFKETKPVIDAPVDVSGGMQVVQAATVLSLVAKSRRRERKVLDVAMLIRAAVEVWERKESRWRERPATSKMMSLLAATLGPSSGVAAGRTDSGGLLMAARMLVACSPRDGATIRELNETAVDMNSSRLAVLVVLSHVKKVEYSMLFTDLSSPAFHRLHSVTSDF